MHGGGPASGESATGAGAIPKDDAVALGEAELGVGSVEVWIGFQDEYTNAGNDQPENKPTPLPVNVLLLCVGIVEPGGRSHWFAMI